MSNNLCQNGLGLVPKRIVGRLVPMGRELEWFIELPLEVQLQAHWDLITGESVGFITLSGDGARLRQLTYMSFVGNSN
jgi:hypothetical protein